MDYNNRHIDQYGDEEQNTGKGDDEDNDDIVTVLGLHVTDVSDVVTAVLARHVSRVCYVGRSAGD